MIKNSELKPILAKIRDNALDNFAEDQKTLQDNLKLRVFDHLESPLPEDLEFAIRGAANEVLEACASLCITHDAEVIKATLAYIRKSL